MKRHLTYVAALLVGQFLAVCYLCVPMLLPSWLLMASDIGVREVTDIATIAAPVSTLLTLLELAIVRLAPEEAFAVANGIKSTFTRRPEPIHVP